MSNLPSPHSKKTLDSLWRLEKIILDSLDFNEVVQEICDSILLELGYLDLGYEIVVLSLVDEKDKIVRRIAISQTEKAKQAVKESPVPFKHIIIPMHHNDNLLIQAMKHKKPYSTTNWHDILTPSFSEAESKTIQADLGIKASLVYPVTNKNKAIGAIIFSMSKPVKEVSPEEKDLIRSFVDIVGLAVQNATLYSELEQTTQKLKRANRNLKHLDKLKDEFVFIATHELKNPVTAMRGYLSMMQEGLFGAIPAKLKEPVDQLQSSNQQLVDLVNDLLQIARSEAKTLSINTSPVELNAAVEKVITNLKPLADQKKITLKHQKLRQKAIVLADELRLIEIVNNLISNAIKYSEKGTITVHREIKDKLLLTHVTDQGYGIAEKDKGKIFTRFFRVEEEAAKGIPGTGLGLFIVKQMVEKMGGEIWFTSEYGKGTTFSFSLPQAK